MDKRYTIINDNCLDALDKIEENSIDCIITDPPYGLTTITKRFGKENSAPSKYGKDGSFQRLTKGFMGQEWDGSGIEYNVELWKKALKTLKSGGYLLAFGGSRTFHRIACAIEDAGFEIRDTIMWLYGSGFPKSMSLSKGLEAREKLGNAGTRNKRKIEQSCDTEEYTLKQTNNGAMGEMIETNRKQYIPDTDLAKQWQGWGTALKPSYEPIIVARKPFTGSLVDNVMKYGVGGINIDECRIEINDNLNGGAYSKGNYSAEDNVYKLGTKRLTGKYKQPEGRFPSNLILTYDDTDYNEVCGGMPYTQSYASEPNWEKSNCNSVVTFNLQRKSGIHFGDSGCASRYFYCAKASKKDRDEGLNEFENGNITDGRTATSDRPYLRKETLRKNIHPTVKPTELMQYLIRLVAPKGATIMDIFMGSGSTGKAVAYENKEYQKDYKFIGIELSKEYCEIAKARIEYADKYVISSIEKETRERDVAPEQMSIFDLEV